MLAAYAVPGAVVWLALGLALGALPLGEVALVAAAAYGAWYGLIETWGRGGLPAPGRRWQVPQTMLIDASTRRRVVVWGAILGPGFATRNPYAGFGALPLAVAAMRGPAQGLALGAAIGAAHGAARAAGLLRDIRELRPVPAVAGGAAVVAAATGSLAGTAGGAAGTAGGAASTAGGAASTAVPTHLDLLLKTVYWRRADGVLLLALAAAAAVAAAGHFA